MKFASLLVSLLLTSQAALLAQEAPRRLLLVGQSPDNHSAGTHEYMPGMERLAKLLKATPNLEVQVVKADEPWTDGPQQIAASDGVVIFVSEGAKWLLADPRRHEAFTQLAARGGGLAALHWAIGTREVEPIEAFQKLFGGCHGGPDRKYQIVRGELTPAEPAHPIAKGVSAVPLRDEFYYRLKFVDATPGIEPVMRIRIDGQMETVAWAWQRDDGGRSFGFSGLHFDDNWELSEYQKLIKQGVLWTLKLPLE